MKNLVAYSSVAHLGFVVLYFRRYSGSSARGQLFK
ncbi:MAG: hypothetical protein IPJ60_19150 [Sphingobacteriaceae bacterium]|nr:hypothetical protein [Sphingobacteriaceae bacterium]